MAGLFSQFNTSARKPHNFGSEASQKGLTLVELLIAITLSVVLAGLTLQLFQSVIKDRESLGRAADSLNQLQLAHRLLTQDLIQIVSQATYLDEFSQSESALKLEPDGQLTLVRSGWVLPEWPPQKRSELQLVRWQLIPESNEICRHTVVAEAENGFYCLVRSYRRPELAGQDFRIQDVVAGIDQLSWRLRISNPGEDGGQGQSIRWTNTWPERNEPSAERVDGLEVTINHRRYGEIKWLWAINGGAAGE